MERTETQTVTERVKNLFRPDTVGPAECPILHRWTLFPPGMGSNSSSTKRHATVPDWLPKLLLHHFMPQADERHSHDHPRGFWTLVLRGGYDDLVPCWNCHGHGRHATPGIPIAVACWGCQGEGVVVGDVMRAGMLRYRPPEHIHRTRVHPQGAWSLVLMGPKRREWGFWLNPDRWMEWKEYFDKYGFGMRCV